MRVAGCLLQDMRLLGLTRVVLLMFLAAPATIQSASSARLETDSVYEVARREMVRTQIAARGISDKRVLEALTKVERHKFVPRQYRRYAYVDNPLPIDADQTISQPYIVALMTELLQLDGSEKVLEIGTGSGYQAAILGELAGEVYSIEIIDTLARTAERRLKQLGYRNVTVLCADGYEGWPEMAPFDGIIVTCAPPEIPEPLLDQLAEGGRMIIPVGKWWQELVSRSAMLELSETLRALSQRKEKGSNP